MKFNDLILFGIFVLFFAAFGAIIPASVISQNGSMATPTPTPYEVNLPLIRNDPTFTPTPTPTSTPTPTITPTPEQLNAIDYVLTLADLPADYKVDEEGVTEIAGQESGYQRQFQDDTAFSKALLVVSLAVVFEDENTAQSYFEATKASLLSQAGSKEIAAPSFGQAGYGVRTDAVSNGFELSYYTLVVRQGRTVLVIIAGGLRAFTSEGEARRLLGLMWAKYPS